MADLAALSRAERERRRLEPNAWYDTPAAPSIDTGSESVRGLVGLPNLNAQPGDPDFDWERYDAWKALQDDPVAQAKPLVAKHGREQRRGDIAQAAEQGEAFERGDIPSEGLTGGMVGRELLRSFTSPTALALAGGAAAAPFTAGASLPTAAALLGGGTAAGHLAGDIAQGLQGSPEVSESLPEALKAASLSGLLAGGGAGVLGGAAKGANYLRNLRGGGGAALDVAADLAPGSIGRVARLLRRSGGGSGGRSTATAEKTVVADDMPLPARISPWRSAQEVPYRAGGSVGDIAPIHPAPGEREGRVFRQLSREGAFRGDRTTGAPPDSPLADVESRLNARYAGIEPEPLPFTFEGSSTGRPGELPPPGLSVGSAFRQLHPSQAVPTSRSLAGLRPAAPDVEIPADFTFEAIPTEIGGTRPPPALIPEIVGEELALPQSWQQFTENPVTQDIRRILEDLMKRPTRGLTNPTGQ